MSGCLFGLQRPLHDILGGGTVADMLLWKNRNLSAAILVVVTVIWLLFEILEYNFITLLCYFLCFIMITLFIWSKAAGLIPMSPPTVDEIRLSDRTCTSLFANVNCLLTKFYDISCGENLKLYILAFCAWKHYRLCICDFKGRWIILPLKVLKTCGGCLTISIPKFLTRFQGHLLKKRSICEQGIL
ncbi:hypothetical protein CICLE_v10016859mg [Citrus x clementina]|uniref:Reticulon-like protein n=2 Tax=Citrus TaxID=2706 RepID=V4W6D0_CITCL|nr:reticulon-like protein B14 isoform X2 [Citrus x clementina]ESR61644.1 hypothetical protein CICLE_v10016859mg [Citrus x clementina]